MILLQGCYSLCFFPQFKYRNSKALKLTEKDKVATTMHTNGYYYYFIRNDSGHVVSLKYFMIFNDNTANDHNYSFTKVFQNSEFGDAIFENRKYQKDSTLTIEQEVLNSLDSITISEDFYSYYHSWGNWRVNYDTLDIRRLMWKKQCANDIYQSKYLFINDSTLLPLYNGWINERKNEFDCDTCYFHFRRLLKMPDASNKAWKYWKE